MSHEEKNTILQIVLGVAINVWLAVKISWLYSTGALDDASAVRIWANAVFWVFVLAIPIGIALTVAGTIIFSLLETIFSGESDTECLVDERDKMMAGYSNQVTLFSMGTGFILLVSGINFGYDIVDSLVVFLFFVSIGGLLGEVVKLAKYRMGA